MPARTGNGWRKLGKIGCGAVYGGLHGLAIRGSAPTRTKGVYVLENGVVFRKVIGVGAGGCVGEEFIALLRRRISIHARRLQLGFCRSSVMTVWRGTILGISADGAA